MHFKTTALAALIVLSSALAALAQGGVLPNLPRELVQGRLFRDGDKVRLCHNPNALLAPFETALAQSLGDALLLEPVIVPVEPRLRTLPYDYRLPFNDDQMFVLMQQECDGFLGFVLAGDSYPQWLTLSVPYLSTNMVMVSPDAAIGRLADLPIDRPIGVRGLSSADYQFLIYLGTLPEQRRWKRHSFYDNGQLMDALRDGRVGAALMWEPALRAMTGGDPESAGLHQFPIPFPTAPVEFGIVLKSNDTFLREAFSQAITSLGADGTIARLLDEALSAMPAPVAAP